MEYPHYESSGRAEAAIRGRQCRLAGSLFEQMIDMACLWYAEQGIAVIEKTPEPMRPISRPNRAGQFKACYTKQAQPDYKGTLRGGRTIVLEAKHTDLDHIAFDRVSDEQRRELTAYHDMGAVAVVLVSFGMQHFYCLPWTVWRDMKACFGRKYIKAEDMPAFRVSVQGGRLDFISVIDKLNREFDITSGSKSQALGFLKCKRVKKRNTARK